MRASLADSEPGRRRSNRYCTIAFTLAEAPDVPVVARLSASLSLRVSRSSTKGRASSGKPFSTARSWSSSAFTSRPNKSAMLLSHSQTRNITRPANGP